MAEIAFTTDRSGAEFEAPRRVLLAGLSDIGETGSHTASARARIAGNPGAWEESHVAFTSEAGNTISFGSHRDGLSHVHRVFAGLSNGEIYRGAYDESLAGLINWDSGAPELNGGGPVTTFAECNGILYAACGLRATNGPSNITGGVYFRHDTSREWELAYRWPHSVDLEAAPPEHRLLRGLTAVPEPHGGGRQVLLGARAWPGVIERIDPNPNRAAGHEVTVELDVRDFLARQWHDERIRTANVTLAYTGFTPAVDPLTGETVHLVGFGVQLAPGETWPDRRSHFLIRHLDATYEVASVDLAIESWPPNADLGAVRAITPSPFADDLPGTLYFGGFDATGLVVQETAWLERGSWGIEPELRLTATASGEWQLDWPRLSPDWIVETGGALETGARWDPVKERSSEAADHQSLRVRATDRNTFFRLRHR